MMFLTGENPVCSSSNKVHNIDEEACVKRMYEIILLAVEPGIL